VIVRAIVVTLALTAPAQAGVRLYVDPPHTNAARQAAKWADNRPRDARLMRALSRIPQAFWFTGGSPRALRRAVDDVVTPAVKSGTVPVLVAYNVPNRDCSGAGARDGRAYRRWIDGFADGIAGRAAIVILEPDALAAACGAHRLAHLRAAVARLPNAYVDAGHSHWQPAATMAKRLRAVHARAFALNISNFRRTPELVRYGTAIAGALGGAHFVIDTSRNGRGPWHGKWCNPPKRGLGARPTTTTGVPLVDAFLWIKPPGESDGTCRHGPAAGAWWPRYALGLARRANPAL
jgi:endoglucanase